MQTDLLIQERSDLLDEALEVGKPAVLDLYALDFGPELLLLRVELRALAAEVR